MQTSKSQKSCFSREEIKMHDQFLNTVWSNWWDEMEQMCLTQETTEMYENKKAVLSYLQCFSQNILRFNLIINNLQKNTRLLKEFLPLF